MKNSIMGGLIAVLLAVSTNISFSQGADADAAKKDNAVKSDDSAKTAKKKVDKKLVIKGKIYFEWSQWWGHNSNSFDKITNYYKNTANASGKNNNTFRINRVYITLQKNFSDIFSARLTTDVSPGAVGSYANMLYLKYAYVRAKKSFGPVSIDLQGGKIGTPVVGFIDDVSDYRWINNNYLDAAKSVLNNQSFDNSADYGVKLAVGLTRYIMLSAAYTNGEGYKKDESYSGKAITAMVNIMPYKGIYISGFGRYEPTAKYDYTGKKAKTWYAGYGVAYKSDLLKAGVNHFFLYKQEVGLASSFNAAWEFPAAFSNYNLDTDIYIYPTQKRGYILIDSWLSINLGAVVKTLPIIAHGRLVYGLTRSTYQKMISDDECGKGRESFLYAGGIGWQFNKNLRILFYYEHQQFRVHKSKALQLADQNGQGWYNLPGVPAGTYNLADYVWVGSKNPRDRQAIYVKSEIKF